MQAERVEKVEYFHIELETHDVIMAEGALSESFIDDDSRGMFHNAHEYATLYPDDVGEPACYCAPRLDERLRRRGGASAPSRCAPVLLRAADPPRIGALDGISTCERHAHRRLGAEQSSSRRRRCVSTFLSTAD